MLYRVVLVVLFLIALLLTLNERLQERRSQQMAAGTTPAPAAFGSGDSYPVPAYATAPPGGPTATAIRADVSPPYPVSKP